jgi:hypothetical protein
MVDQTSIPWRSIGVFIGIIAAFFSVMAVMIQWRFDVLQSQLADRMTLYEREMNKVDQRLEHLERP